MPGTQLGDVQTWVRQYPWPGETHSLVKRQTNRQIVKACCNKCCYQSIYGHRGRSEELSGRGSKQGGLHRRAKPWWVEGISLDWGRKGIILKAMVNHKTFSAGDWQDQVWILERSFCWPLVNLVEVRRTGGEEEDPLTVAVNDVWVKTPCTKPGTIETEGRFKIYWQDLGLVRCRRWKSIVLDEFKVSVVGD